MIPHVPPNTNSAHASRSRPKATPTPEPQTPLPTRWADAERSLLGNMLHVPPIPKGRESHIGTVVDAIVSLGTYQWSNERNRAIFGAIKRITETGTLAGPDAVRAELIRVHHAEAAAFVTELGREFFSDADLNYWAVQCVELSLACATYSAADRLKQALDAGQTMADVTPTLATLADAAGTPAGDADDDPPEPPTLREPFPLDCLPPIMRRYASELARAMCVPIEYAVAPILACAAASIGNTRNVIIKADWTVPSMLWMGIVGRSGTGKTPPVKHVLFPLRKREQAEYRKHAEAMAEYAVSMLEYERSLSVWKRGKGIGEPPVTPTMPVGVKYIVDSSTMEGLLDVLRENPRGLLRATDEGMGIFNGLNQYRAGADQETWLSIYSGNPVKIDRKTGVNRSVYIPHPCVSMVTGFQPQILRAAMTESRTESGFMARFLFLAPPGTPKVITSARVSDATYRAWRDAVDRMVDMPMPVDADGEPEPMSLTLTADAQAAFFEWSNDNSQITLKAEPPLAYALSKIEEIPARLGLIFTVFGDANATEVSMETMQAAIKLGGWFRTEATRLYGAYAETPQETAHRDLLDIIHRYGGRITPRELSRTCRKYRGKDVARGALDKLVTTGFARLEVQLAPGSVGGKPSDVYVLTGGDAPTGANTPENIENINVLSPSPVSPPQKVKVVSPAPVAPEPAPATPPEPTDDDRVPADLEQANANTELARQAEADEETIL